MERKNKIFYGWLLCLSGTLMLIGGAGIVINSASQFLKPVCEALHVSRGQFSIYLSMVSVASMVFSPLIGKVFEKWSPRIVTICAGSFMALMWTCLSFAGDIRLFYVLGFLIGAGSAFCGMVSVNILMNNWFHASKGTAMGIALTGSGIGSMIFNPVASRLIEAFGYQTAYRCMGLFIFLCAVPMFLLYRYKPADIGLAPLGLEAKSGESGEKAGHQGEAQEGIMRSEAVKTADMWALCFIIFGLSAGSMGIFTQLAAYFTDVGYEQNTAAGFVSVASFGMAFGKLFFGWLNDKIGTRWNFTLMTSLAVAGIILLFIARSTILTMAGAALFGIAVASPFVLSPQITLFTFGGKDFPNIYGFGSIFLFLGPSLAPPLSGVIYDKTGSYAPAFILYTALLSAVLVTGLLLLAKGGYRKRSEYRQTESVNKTAV
ncbi:MFS transporter [Bacilliculturomica massiliensis]|uniref:MFS transporter n=1 Tax=Bacilliculturomica massiliensis TaxID=1917867 RepID=UPI0010314A1D|nr:MFS transporter [Bacilliculturomica massiliensis]